MLYRRARTNKFRAILFNTLSGFLIPSFSFVKFFYKIIITPELSREQERQVSTQPLYALINARLQDEGIYYHVTSFDLARFRTSILLNLFK
jgi:hypothetical protein